MCFNLCQNRFCCWFVCVISLDVNYKLRTSLSLTWRGNITTFGHLRSATATLILCPYQVQWSPLAALYGKNVNVTCLFIRTITQKVPEDTNKTWSGLGNGPGRIQFCGLSNGSGIYVCLFVCFGALASCNLSVYMKNNRSPQIDSENLKIQTNHQFQPKQALNWLLLTLLPCEICLHISDYTALLPPGGGIIPSDFHQQISHI